MLENLRIANQKRQLEWDGNNQLSLTYQGNELAGECGEACNVIKKLERERLGLRGSRATLQDLADELSDVVIVADLIAARLSIDLASAVINKFNATSEKYGLKTRMVSPSEYAGPGPQITITEAARTMMRGVLQKSPLWADTDTDQLFQSDDRPKPTTLERVAVLERKIQQLLRGEQPVSRTHSEEAPREAQYSGQQKEDGHE